MLVKCRYYEINLCWILIYWRNGRTSITYLVPVFWHSVSAAYHFTTVVCQAETVQMYRPEDVGVNILFVTLPARVVQCTVMTSLFACLLSICLSVWKLEKHQIWAHRGLSSISRTPHGKNKNVQLWPWPLKAWPWKALALTLASSCLGYDVVGNFLLF